VGRDQQQRARPRRRPHRIGQDAGRVPLVARPAGRRSPAGRRAAALPRPLRLAAEGTGRRRRAQPSGTAGGHRAGGSPAGSEPPRDPGRHPVRGHARRRAPGVHPAADRHPHHHPGVAVPTPHQRRAGGAAGHRDGDRRRGARRRRHQAGRPPRGVPRPIGRAARTPGAADRPVGHRTSDRGGRHLPRRWAAGADRGAALGETVGPVRRRPGRGHERTRPADRRAGGVRRGQPATDVDLAGGRGAGARPGAGPPQHDRVRQLPAAGRAADKPAQRAGLRTRHGRDCSAGHERGGADGAGRFRRWRARRRPARGRRAPRLCVARSGPSSRRH
jgi:hypothetical protein